MKILCINGGGVFGIIPAYLLSLTVDKLDIFETFSGTSIGSQLALSYCLGKNTRKVFNDMAENMPNIFTNTIFERLNPYSPKYNDKNLNKILKKLLPGVFSDLKCNMVIPTYDIVGQKPKIFDNIRRTNNDDLDWENWEIARASSAAPTYFKPYEGLIDGGVVANNPSIVTAWALSSKMKLDFEEMEILVLGTGFRKELKYTTNEIDKWSQLQWLKPILNLVMVGNEQIFDFGCRHMPFKKFKMIDLVELDNEWDMDDVNIMDDVLDQCDLISSKFKYEFEDFIK